MECFEALKKNFVICYIKDGPWWYYAKWNEPIKNDKYCMIPLLWVSTVIKSMETENIILVAKVCEEEELENCCSMGIGLQSCKMKISTDLL